jgi:hypothetical protein
MTKPSVPKSFPLEQRVIPIFPFISIKRWLLLNDATDPSKSPEVIGFVFDNQNYYINPGLSPEAAFKKAKKFFCEMNFDEKKRRFKLCVYVLCRLGLPITGLLILLRSMIGCN